MAKSAVSFVLALVLAAAVLEQVHGLNEACCVTKTSQAACAAACDGDCMWVAGVNACVPKEAKKSGGAATGSGSNYIFKAVPNPTKATDTCDNPCGDSLCCYDESCHDLWGLHWCM